MRKKLRSGAILGIGLPVIFALSIIIGLVYMWWSFGEYISVDFVSFYIVIMMFVFPSLCAPFLYWFFFQRRRKLLGLPTRINGPNGIFFIVWTTLVIIFFLLPILDIEGFLLFTFFLDGFLLLLLIPFGIWTKREGKILDAIEKVNGNYENYEAISEILEKPERKCRKKVGKFIKRKWLGEGRGADQTQKRYSDDGAFLNGKTYLISHPSSNVLLVITLIFGKYIFFSGGPVYYYSFNLIRIVPGLLLNLGLLFFFIAAVLLFTIKTKKRVKLFAWLAFSLYSLGRILALSLAYDHYYHDWYPGLEQAEVASDIIIWISLLLLLIGIIKYRKTKSQRAYTISVLIIFCIGYFVGFVWSKGELYQPIFRSFHIIPLLLLFSFLITFRRYLKTLHKGYEFHQTFSSARNYERAHNYEKAIALYKEAGSLSDVQRLVNKQGRKAETAGRLEEAIFYYQKANNTDGVKRLQKKMIDNFLKNNEIEKAATLSEEIGKWDLAGKIRRGEVRSIQPSTQDGSREAVQTGSTSSFFSHSSGSSPSHSYSPPEPANFRPRQGSRSPRPPFSPSYSPVEQEKIDEIFSGLTYKTERKEKEVRSSLQHAIPGYTITHKIGSGGSATVYRALDDKGEEVAIKLPKFIDETVSTSVLEQFRSEANMWQKLGHKNIVRFHKGDVRPVPFLVIEYMDGGNLKDLMDNNRLSVKKGMDIMLQILDAVSYAHRMASVHRDIKPENILFTASGTPKISDWGIGKFMASESATKSMGTKGTLLYSAPEQISKRKFGNVDWSTDIFQLGILLYEILTDSNPFHDEDTAGIVGNILYEEPQPPRGLDPAIPKELEQIVMKALEKNKEDRWRSADIMYNELRRVVRDGGEKTVDWG